jgi:AcrR family transcriptional regulator
VQRTPLRQPEEHALESQQFPSKDPVSELSPTATRILMATRRLLAQRGFTGLSLEAIAADAGENKASIRYHFGNKAGLITALIDSVVHDDSVALMRELRSQGASGDRTGTLIASHRRVSRGFEGYQLFFDLLPNMLRDDTLAPRLATLYQWYRQLDSWALAAEAGAETRERLAPLSPLTVAVCDGLAIQYASDRAFDVDAAFDLWERLVRAALAELLGDSIAS